MSTKSNGSENSIKSFPFAAIIVEGSKHLRWKYLLLSKHICFATDEE